MERGHNRADGREILERLATFRVLALLLGTLALGFSCVPRGSSAVPEAPAESVGAANLSDVDGAVTEEGLAAAAEPAPPPDQGLFYVVYRVVKGDTIWEIAASYGVTTDSIVTFNNITNARTLSIGKYLKIPTLNGILYAVKKGETATALAASYGISAERIKELGGEPATAGDGKVTKGQDVRKIFPFDANLEDVTIDAYNQFLQVCRECGDNISTTLFQTIIDEEQIHFNHFDNVAGHIKNLGDAYLSRIAGTPASTGGATKGFALPGAGA